MKKVIVTGPALSQSGYGEQCRFALRSLLSKTELFDVYLHATNWGKTSWLLPDDKDKEWIDALVRKTHFYIQNGGGFDISIQVTIPNEWKKIAPVNIGYTAGIETTHVAPEWIEKSYEVDKIITVGHHGRNVFLETKYPAVNDQTQEQFLVGCETPIEVAHYPVRHYTPANIGINLEYDFNFLAVAQWGPRKNLENTIRWWLDEFKDEEVGLVVKTSAMKNSVVDRVHTTARLNNLLSEYQDRKCKVYLLHGYMTPEELTGLYQNEKIKCFVTLTHGEGFGLPIFEAAYNGLPVIAPDWSGQSEFLHAERKLRRNKKTVKKVAPCFAPVDYELKPIPPEVVWKGVLHEGSKWCYPKENSYKKTLRKVYNDYGRYKNFAKILKKHIFTNFEEQAKYQTFCDAVYKPVEGEMEWLQKLAEIDVM